VIRMRHPFTDRFTQISRRVCLSLVAFPGSIAGFRSVFLGSNASPR